LALVHQPPEVPPPVIVGDWSPEAAIRDGSANCGDCRITRGRFIVFNDWHAGTSLRRAGRPNEYISVIMENPQVDEQFGLYFSRQHLARLIGRRTYCDCRGVLYTTPGGGEILNIVSARLFDR
jgi:hypothetical protein